jgi:hypothetical protein
LAYLAEKDDHRNSLLGKRPGQEDLKIFPPKIINLVPRLCQDLKALYSFFKLESLPKVTVRSRRLALVLHGFADVSKSGFGSTLSHGLNTRYRIGIWSCDEEDQCSNYREFANLVETMEFDGREGLLSELVVYMATDNATVENCLYKGISSSPKLHDLIVRLRKAELEFGFRLFVTHVSGKRMMFLACEKFWTISLRQFLTLSTMSSFSTQLYPKDAPLGKEYAIIVHNQSIELKVCFVGISIGKATALNLATKHGLVLAILPKTQWISIKIRIQ